MAKNYMNKPNAKEYRKLEREKLKKSGDLIDKYYSHLFNLAKDLSVAGEGMSIKTPFGWIQFHPAPLDSYQFSYKLANDKKKK